MRFDVRLAVLTRLQSTQDRHNTEAAFRNHGQVISSDDTTFERRHGAAYVRVLIHTSVEALLTCKDPYSQRKRNKVDDVKSTRVSTNVRPGSNV